MFEALLMHCARRFPAIEVNASCMMTTHYHLIITQHRAGDLEGFMTALMSRYVRYFNRRHGLRGSLFAGPYRARRLISPKDLCWAIGYVHDNHPDGPDWRFSTHRAYLDPDQRPGWLHGEPALKLFGGVEGYKEFMRARAERARYQDMFF